MISAAVLTLSLLQAAVTRDLKTDEQGWMTLGHGDPYVVYEVPSENRMTRAVYLKYSSKNVPDKYFLEVFFATDLHEIEKQHRYFMSVPGKKVNELVVPLDMFDNEWLTKLRVDFVGCAKCEIRFDSVDLLETTTERQLALVPDTYKPLTGTKNREVPGEGRVYELPEFHIADLEHLGDTRLRVSGEQPFISSPVLDYTLTQAAGVLFKMKLPAGDRQVRYLSFAWHTHKYGYRDKLRIRLPNVMDGEKDKVTEFFIPFTALADEKVVHRFRFSFEPVVGEVWDIKEIKLIPRNSESQYASLIPEAVVDYPGTPGGAKNIFAGGFEKMMRDKPFFLLFAFAFVCLVVGLVRACRRPQA